MSHHVEITYCVPWDYSSHAVRVADELVSNYQHVLDDLRLVMGSKGVFDVTVDGDVLYSKAETGRHAEPGEVLSAFADFVGSDVRRYGE